MNELALFAGAGGGILGGHLLGWRTVCAVEIEPYPASLLLARQNDGVLPPFPVWDDVRTFDGRPWRGIVDVISGGFPCQDISSAGKGAGIDGKRSGLWAEMRRIVCEVRPRWVFVENSPMLTSRGLGRVLGDLAALGYDAEWVVLGADDAGAPHIRKRIWILARDTDPDGLHGAEHRGEHARPQVAAGCGADGMEAGSDLADTDLQRAGRRVELPQGSQGARCMDRHSAGEHVNTQLEIRSRQDTLAGGVCEHVADASVSRQQENEPIRTQSQKPLPCSDGRTFPYADLSGREKQRRRESAREEYATAQRGSWWQSEPRVGRVVDGLAARVDRLKALGNGQVPAVAALAFRILHKRLMGAEYNM